jgi:cytochrome c551/c552
MKRFVNRGAWLMLALIALMLGLTACQPDASADIISPELGSRLAAREAGAQLEIVPTPAPLQLADLTPDEIYAGLPVDISTAMATANPSNGQTLALANGCVGCHAVDPAIQMTGPNWHDIGNVAVNRIATYGPALYLYESIVAPNAYIVPGYAPNIMPQNYDQILSEQDLADMVAYLLAQTGE